GDPLELRSGGVRDRRVARRHAPGRPADQQKKGGGVSGPAANCISERLLRRQQRRPRRVSALRRRDSHYHRLRSRRPGVVAPAGKTRSPENNQYYPKTVREVSMRKLFAFAMMFLAAAALADELAVGMKAPAFSLINAVDGKTV